MPVTFSKLTKPPNKCYRHFNNVIKEVCYYLGNHSVMEEISTYKPTENVVLL